MAANPQQPRIPEGEKYLVIRLTAKGEFSIAFNDLVDAQALYRIAGLQLDTAIRKQLGMDGGGAIAIPNVTLPSFADLQKRGS